MRDFGLLEELLAQLVEVHARFDREYEVGGVNHSGVGQRRGVAAEALFVEGDGRGPGLDEVAERFAQGVFQGREAGLGVGVVVDFAFFGDALPRLERGQFAAGFDAEFVEPFRVQ